MLIKYGTYELSSKGWTSMLKPKGTGGQAGNNNSIRRT